MHRRAILGTAASMTLAGCTGVLPGGGPSATERLERAGDAIVDVHDEWYRRRLDLAPEGGTVDFRASAVASKLETATETVDAAAAAAGDDAAPKVDELRSLVDGVGTFVDAIPAVAGAGEEFAALTDRATAGEFGAVAADAGAFHDERDAAAGPLDDALSTVRGVDTATLEDGDPFSASEVSLVVRAWPTTVELVREYVAALGEVVGSYEALAAAAQGLRSARAAVEDGNLDRAVSDLDAAANDVAGAENAVSRVTSVSSLPTAYLDPVEPAECVTEAAMESAFDPIQAAQAAASDGAADRATDRIETALSGLSGVDC